jgi:1-deoxy-D-xylulose-5-phosphate reductoisomerase
MVDYADGSVLAQLGNPDMRTPIAHALAWPERIESGAKPLDILETGRLDFEAVDLQRFPALRLAYEAWEQRGTAAAILNAANEVAVRAFLERRLAFTGIPRIIEATLARCASREANSLDVILEDDAVARDTAMTILAGERRKVAP